VWYSVLRVDMVVLKEWVRGLVCGEGSIGDANERPCVWSRRRGRS
jgi:hypothetical protein